MERRKGRVKEVSETELRERLAEQQPDNRRREERIPARLEVEIPVANLEQLRRVYTTNISKGGLLFSLEAPATVPAALTIELTLPDGRRVSFASEVRHVRRRDGENEYEVGVQFRDLEPDVRGVLESALAGLGKA